MAADGWNTDAVASEVDDDTLSRCKKMAVGRCFRIYHKYLQGYPYSLILENARNTDEFVLLESGVVASLASKDCEDFKKQYTKLADGYGCLGILQLHSGSSPVTYLVTVSACVSVGKIAEYDIYRITGVQFHPMWRPSPPGLQDFGDERVTEIQKLVSSGMFYFAWSAGDKAIIDLSLCSQKRHEQGSVSDHRFFWNRTLHLPFQRYGVDTDRWLMRCMCGSVLIKTVYVGVKTAKACLISRLSCERMGTRFNVRGVNDDGHVANFVETEQLIVFDNQEASFVQTRGSIPLFWEQPGVQVGSHKVKLSRGFEASAPAYDRHFKLLKHYYGDQIIANLLGIKEGERMLGQAFKTHHDNSSHRQDVPFIHFDYHAMVRVGNKPQNMGILWDKVKQSVICDFAFFHAAKVTDAFHNTHSTTIRSQKGTVRTNCLDCLDRTNCVQSYIGLQMLEEQLLALRVNGEQQPNRQPQNFHGRFHEVYKDLWTQNGDQCSRIYAGTGALEGKSKIKDASRSVARTIQNNLMDGSKQEAMDLFLLGTALTTELYDRASALLPVNLMQACPNVLASLVERAAEYTVGETLRVMAATWNVNGGKNFDNVAFRYKNKEPLSDWLLDLPQKSLTCNLVDVNSSHDFSTPVDIYAIGFEEIVDLNASNIMNASTTNQRLWGDALKKTLTRDHKYIMITSCQLVGVCLFVYVRPHLAPHIRDLSVEMVKTGMGGATGNKGGVAIRFLLHSSSFCFVCSHFAAGQSQVTERNNDFGEQSKRILFPMGRTVYSHDFVFWLGDFNYRIDLSGEEVKRLVRDNDLQPLVDADQLTNQRLAGHTFMGFLEGPLTFAPTYKYDNYSDDYDTSEKARTPAWTDRVLYRARPVFCREEDGLSSLSHEQIERWTQTACALLFYGRAELKTSDHRPVGAIFDVEVKQVDRKKREEIYKEVVGCMGPPDATVLVSVPNRCAELTFPMDLVDSVIAKVAQLCIQVLLVKFVGQDMWLIFKDGEMALAAMSMDGVNVGENADSQDHIQVRLRSSNWEEQCRKDLNELKWTADDLLSFTLLSEDVDDMSRFENEDEYDELSVGGGDGSQTPRSRSGSPMVERKAPPPRPAAPPQRPPPPGASGALRTANPVHQHSAQQDGGGRLLGVTGGMVPSRSCEPLSAVFRDESAPWPTDMTRTTSGDKLLLELAADHSESAGQVPPTGPYDPDVLWALGTPTAPQPVVQNNHAPPVSGFAVDPWATVAPQRPKDVPAMPGVIGYPTGVQHSGAQTPEDAVLLIHSLNLGQSSVTATNSGAVPPAASDNAQPPTAPVQNDADATTTSVPPGAAPAIPARRPPRMTSSSGANSAASSMSDSGKGAVDPWAQPSPDAPLDGGPPVPPRPSRTVARSAPPVEAPPPPPVPTRPARR